MSYEARGTTYKTMHRYRWYQCNRKAWKRGLCRKHNRVVDAARKGKRD